MGIYEVGIDIPGVAIDSLVDGWLNVGVHEAQNWTKMYDTIDETSDFWSHFLKLIYEYIVYL